MAVFLVSFNLMFLAAAGVRSSAAATTRSITVVGHVICRECSEPGSFLPDVIVSLECRSPIGELDYSAVKTTDLNGAFMVSFPEDRLTPDAKCEAHVLVGPDESTIASASSVPMNLISSRDNNLVYTVGPLFYMPKHAFHQ